MTRRHAPQLKKRHSPPGRLRIVAGKWRSRLLPVADVAELRPTPERVRETLFNWLMPEIEGARCLDLFAGTGALGFEALSRGAQSVDFVECAPPAAAAIRAAAEALEATHAAVRQQDVFAFLAEKPPQRYDIVFLDPPYADESLGKLCRLLAAGDWLKQNARVYFEHPKDRPRLEFPASWSVSHEKVAGHVRYGLATCQSQ